AAAGGHGAESHGDGGHHGGGALHALPGWAQGLVTIGVIVGIVIAGRFLMRPVFRFIAEARLREIFTAAALLLVIGIALLMTAIGLSPALGTFLAGVVLSDNEYRHELESDIEPFKGLLLGLFFLTVGAGVDFGLLMAEPLVIVGLAIGLLLIKGAVLFCLAIAFGIKGADRWLFALGMAQAGEFAFVLFGFSLGAGVMGPELIGPLTLIVALSMLMTPLLFILHERVLAPRAIKGAEREPDPVTEPSTVVMAGMGRFGQVVGRLLVSNGYRVVVLDQDPGTIETLNKVGLKTYYGDASRPDLLHSAGLHDADLFVAAGDDREKTNLMVEHVAKTYPHVRILARAHDRHHVYDLEKHGAHIVEREAFEGALSLGKAALRELGMHPFRAETQTRAFRRHDLRSLDALRARYNAGGMDGEYIDAAKALSDELMKVMQSDRSDQHDRSERGWTPPPKGDATL
ncbi:MAG: cation:proton antiporter, partial [Rhodospirillaceae bacterium]